MITVFTPTYNRAHTIGKVFESLKRQTYKDFEWLVVDDGSKDDTGSVIDGFAAEKPFFEIVYKYKENGGKHTAMNLAGDVAHGELLVICDSDDWLTDDALERIVYWYGTVKDNDKIAGVIGREIVTNRDRVIKEERTAFDPVDIAYHHKEEHGIAGEDAFAFKTEIFKRYKFPEIKGERYMAESVQLDMMYFDGYLFRFVDEVYMYGSYLEDGLTYDYTKVNHDNPRGYALWRIIEAKLYGRSPSHLAKKYYDYRCEMHYRYSDREISDFLGIPYLYLKLIVAVYAVGKKIKKNEKAI